MDEWTYKLIKGWKTGNAISHLFACQSTFDNKMLYEKGKLTDNQHFPHYLKESGYWNFLKTLTRWFFNVWWPSC